ncbi:tumor protein p53-inducible protein 13 [Pogona vitticeps]
MAEPPPPLPPGAPILLALLSLAGSGAPGGGGQIYFQQDLPPGERPCCRGGYGPTPLQESRDVFGDAKRICNQSSIPDRGGSRHLIWEAYRREGFHPPQKFLRGLQHKDVALFYHPCLHPSLRRQLIRLARACGPHIQLTPHRSLPWEQPPALASWDIARRRPKVELARDGSRQLTRQPGANESEEGGRKGRPVWELAPLLAKIRAVCRSHRAQAFQRFFRKQAEKKPSKPQPRRRRAFLWPGRTAWFPKAQSGNRNLAATTSVHRTSATSLPTGKKDVPEPSGPEGEGRLSAPPHPGPQVSPAALSTEADRVAPATGCPCPGGDLRKAHGLLGKAVKGLPGRGAPRVPTPRTEEAAWAASALAFLLAVLTLAVLYTRLHRKCRRGRSLYWTTAGEEGQDTVAAVLKRRLLSAQARRKKRPRPLPQRPLWSETSSDSSE